MKEYKAGFIECYVLQLCHNSRLHLGQNCAVVNTLVSWIFSGRMVTGSTRPLVNHMITSHFLYMYIWVLIVYKIFLEKAAQPN